MQSVGQFIDLAAGVHVSHQRAMRQLDALRLPGAAARKNDTRGIGRTRRCLSMPNRARSRSTAPALFSTSSIITTRTRAANSIFTFSRNAGDVSTVLIEQRATAEFTDSCPAVKFKIDRDATCQRHSDIGERAAYASRQQDSDALLPSAIDVEGTLNAIPAASAFPNVTSLPVESASAGFDQFFRAVSTNRWASV